MRVTSISHRAAGAVLLFVGTLSCGGETTRPVDNLVPSISSIAPNATPMGTAGAIDITGTDFVPGSRVVLLNGASSLTVRAVTLLSATSLRAQLTAEQAGTPGDYALSVENPLPGGGLSNPLNFQIRAPAPIATSLSRASAPVSPLGDTLFVTGSGFYAESSVRFNGGIRATSLVSPTRLQVILLAGDLSTPGTFDITVVNPTPGGGTAAALPFSVVVLPPQITSLPAEGGSAGQGFSLAVDGLKFVKGATVQWNGTDRPTIFRSSRRLVTTISAGDATPGTEA
jgi:hypothetical protein